MVVDFTTASNINSLLSQNNSPTDYTHTFISIYDNVFTNRRFCGWGKQKHRIKPIYNKFICVCVSNALPFIEAQRPRENEREKRHREKNGYFVVLGSEVFAKHARAHRHAVNGRSEKALNSWWRRRKDDCAPPRTPLPPLPFFFSAK